jgi:nitrate/nitrite transporter NarK
LLNRRVVLLSAVYIGIVAANVGLGFFLPLLVQDFGASTTETTIITAVPYAAAFVAMILWGRRSDRVGERRIHSALPQLVAGGTLAASAMLDDPAADLAAVTLAACGIFSSIPIFWTLPTGFLSGRASAGGIAMINSAGNLAGFVGAYIMGWTRDATGTYVTGLMALAAAILLSGSLALAMAKESATPDVRAAPNG